MQKHPARQINCIFLLRGLLGRCENTGPAAGPVWKSLDRLSTNQKRWIADRGRVWSKAYSEEEDCLIN
jgi:hypothetical protein